MAASHHDHLGHVHEFVAVYFTGVVLAQQTANAHQPADERPGGRRGQICRIGKEIQRSSGNRASARALRGGRSDVSPVLERKISPERVFALAIFDPYPLSQTNTTTDGCADRCGCPESSQ